jgi:ABC-2 type transport system permease protein
LTFLFRRTLTGFKVQLIAYGLGMIAYLALIVFLTPSITEELEDVQYPEGFEAFFGDIDFSDSRNFISVEAMTLGPLILAIFAVTIGTGTLAGEEGRGTLEVLLAQPLSRRAVFVQKTGGLVLAMILVCLAGCAGFLVSVPLVDLGDEVSTVDLVLAPLVWLPFLLLCVSVSLLLGALAPSRGQAVAFTAAFIVLTYLAASLAEAADVLRPLKYASAFYYSDTQRILTEGAVIWHHAVVLLAAAVTALLALRSFERRELYAGRWQWNSLAIGPSRRTRRMSAQGDIRET